MAILFKDRRNQVLTEAKQKKDLEAVPIMGVGSASAPASPTPQPQQNIVQEVNAPQEKQKSSSGSFTNLSNYLRANQAGGGLAGRVSGRATTALAGAEQGATGAQEAFQTGSGTSLAGAKTTSDTLANTLANLSGASEADISTAAQAGLQDYAGPSAIDYGNIDNTVSSIGQNLTQGSSSRQGLLQGTFTSAPYSEGMQRLDQALLQTNPSALNQLRETKSRADLLNKQMQSEQQKASEAFDINKRAVEEMKAKDISAINQRVLDEEAALQNKVSSENYLRDKAYKTALTNLGRGILSKSDAEKFGLTSGMATYGLNFADPTVQALLSKGADYTSLTKMSPEQAQNFNTLNRLLNSGELSSEATSKIMAQYAGVDKSALGQAIDPYSLNTEELNKAIEAQRLKYREEYTPLETQFNTTSASLQDIISQLALAQKAYQDLLPNQLADPLTSRGSLLPGSVRPSGAQMGARSGFSTSEVPTTSSIPLPEDEQFNLGTVIPGYDAGYVPEEPTINTSGNETGGETPSSQLGEDSSLLEWNNIIAGGPTPELAAAYANYLDLKNKAKDVTSEQKRQQAAIDAINQRYGGTLKVR